MLEGEKFRMKKPGDQELDEYEVRGEVVVSGEKDAFREVATKGEVGGVMREKRIRNLMMMDKLRSEKAGVTLIYNGEEVLFSRVLDGHGDQENVEIKIPLPGGSRTDSRVVNVGELSFPDDSQVQDEKIAA